ncbi:hypothetical protein ACO0SA_002931 [Hanseniaspora valbyensis]
MELLNIPLSDFNINDYLILNDFFVWENKLATNQILISKRAIHKMKNFEDFFWLVDHIKHLIITRSEYLNFKEMIILDDNDNNNMNVAFKLIEFDTETKAFLYKMTDYFFQKKELSFDYIKNFGGLKILMQSFWNKTEQKKTISNEYLLTSNEFLKLKKIDINPPRIDTEAFDFKIYNECKYNTISLPFTPSDSDSGYTKPVPLQVYELMGWLSFNSYIHAHLLRIKSKKLYNRDGENKSIFEYYIEQGYKYITNKRESTEITDFYAEIVREDDETLVDRLNSISNMNISYKDIVEGRLKIFTTDNTLVSSTLDNKEKDHYNLKLGNFFNFEFTEPNKFLKLNDKNINFASGFIDSRENDITDDESNSYYQITGNEIYIRNSSDVFEEDDYYNNLDNREEEDDDDEEEEEEEDFEQSSDFGYEENISTFSDRDAENDHNNTDRENHDYNLSFLENIQNDDIDTETFFTIKIPKLSNNKTLIGTNISEESVLELNQTTINKPEFKKTVKELNQLILDFFNMSFKQKLPDQAYQSCLHLLEEDLKIKKTVFEESIFAKLFSIQVPIFLILQTITKIYVELRNINEPPPPTPEKLLCKEKNSISNFKELIEPKIVESIFLTVMKKNYNKLIDQRLNSSFKCRKCSNKLCLKENLLSVDYTGLFGKCILLGPKMFNVNYINERLTEMITATYVVKDITCRRCGSYLGWTYLDTTNEAYSYKKDLKIFETRSIFYD